MTAECPTPAKARFATNEAAHIAAARYAKTLRTYQCECDWWHLTSKPAPKTPAADPTVTQHVTALDDTEFELLVGTELRGQATPQQAAALRTDANLKRWRIALDAIKKDINLQLQARHRDDSTNANEWRRRALQLKRCLGHRTTEAEKLYEAAMMRAGTEKARLAAKGLTPSQARAAAGERAIQRLIDANQAEFTRLLLEEYEADELTVPDRVLRQAARHGIRTAA